MTTDDGYPRAYCPPGQLAESALTLALRGEAVVSLQEHPWLAGGKDIILISEPPVFPLPEFRFSEEIRARR